MNYKIQSIKYTASNRLIHFSDKNIKIRAIVNFTLPC